MIRLILWSGRDLSIFRQFIWNIDASADSANSFFNVVNAINAISRHNLCNYNRI